MAKERRIHKQLLENYSTTDSGVRKKYFRPQPPELASSPIDGVRKKYFSTQPKLLNYRLLGPHFNGFGRIYGRAPR